MTTDGLDVRIGDVVMYGERMEPPRFQQVTTDYECRRWVERRSEILAVLRKVWSRKRGSAQAAPVAETPDVTDWCCGGCGHRWAERYGRGATLCGDCWRKVQPVLHASCVGRDPACPCVDGNSCHYLPTADTKAMTPASPPTADSRLVEVVRVVSRWADATRIIRTSPEPTPDMLREQIDATAAMLALIRPATSGTR